LAAIPRSLTIIPLGRSSRYDSSSLPEGCSRPQPQVLMLAPRSRELCNVAIARSASRGRLSPPIWPCTTRGFPCLACCQLELWVCNYKPETLRAVGSYPTFSPLPAKALFSDDEQVSLPPVTEAFFCGGLFSVALSVNRCGARLSRRPLQQLPWRYQARCPFVFARAAASGRLTQTGVRTFLPFTLMRRKEPKGLSFSPNAFKANQRSSSSPAGLLYRELSFFRFGCYSGSTTIESRPWTSLPPRIFLLSRQPCRASIEHVPFSDLERRMMYFTGSDDSCKDPAALSDEFEV